jgi:hypothetical protein
MSRILVLALVAQCAALNLGDGCSGEVAKATIQLVQRLRTAMDTTALLQRELSAVVGENAELRLALNESQRHVLLLTSQMNDDLPKSSPPPAQVPACEGDEGDVSQALILLQGSVALAPTAWRSGEPEISAVVFEAPARAPAQRRRTEPSTFRLCHSICNSVDCVSLCSVKPLRFLRFNLSYRVQVPMKLRSLTPVRALLMD